MIFRHRAALLLLAGAATAVPIPLGAQQSDSPRPSPSPERVCENFALAAGHDGAAPTLAARLVEAADGLPRHCLVEGVINQRTGAGGVEYGIHFELRLPTRWNGRFLLQGGGGLNGSVRPAVGPVAAGSMPALARGFAVASHDSGHQGAGFDASFYADQRAALDFAETSVRTVTQVTRRMTHRFYGEQPHHSYMTGCSTGGREGMLASQRYPELFDGIVIGAPAMRPGHSNLGIEWAQAMLNRSLPADVSGPAGFDEHERGLVLTEVLNQCDARDGVADGMIANVAACRSFDARALACTPGQEAGTCLAPAKVEALQLAFAGPRDASGRPVYVPIPWDTGVTYTGPGLPGYLPSGQPSPFGPATTARDIDIEARLHDLRWDAVGRLTDTAYWTNLSTYLGRGSKLIYFHGVSDPWFSAFDTLDYYDRARAANGVETWDDAARFYMVPGMMHCSGGNAFDSFDMLGPMVDWVEKGEAPAAITASRRAGEAQMPLCPWPSYAHYTGGEVGLAGSYECRTPMG